MNKRRGRKPKGGKIVQLCSNASVDFVPETNIILHLKCKEEDLRQEHESPEVEPFGFEASEHSLVEKQAEPAKDVWAKVRRLAFELHSNHVSSGQSACFWCTCDFDTPVVYIPKHQVGELYQCYGCFCSPECATAHLLNENIEHSTKLERYAMLNYLYADIFGYETNIAPAPDPHYTLSKFYGNLTIEEYRQTFRGGRQLLVIDKPLSRCLPELYEEGATETSFGIKMRKRETKSKADIMKENFMGGVK